MARRVLCYALGGGLGHVTRTRAVLEAAGWDGEAVLLAAPDAAAAAGGLELLSPGYDDAADPAALGALGRARDRRPRAGRAARRRLPGRRARRAVRPRGARRAGAPPHRAAAALGRLRAALRGAAAALRRGRRGRAAAPRATRAPSPGSAAPSRRSRCPRRRRPRAAARRGRALARRAHRAGARGARARAGGRRAARGRAAARRHADRGRRPARPAPSSIRAIPAAPRYAGAAGIVTAAGFNTVRELAPYRDRHVCVPFDRRLDDQPQGGCASGRPAPRSDTCPASGRPTEPRQHLVLQHREELGLPVADLLDVELVEARVGERLEGRHDPLDVRPARHGLGDHLLGHELRRLLEVRGLGEDLGELAAEPLVRPQPVHGLARTPPRRAPSTPSSRPARACRRRPRRGSARPRPRPARPSRSRRRSARPARSPSARSRRRGRPAACPGSV